MRECSPWPGSLIMRVTDFCRVSRFAEAARARRHKSRDRLTRRRRSPRDARESTNLLRMPGDDPRITEFLVSLCGTARASVCEFYDSRVSSALHLHMVL